MEFTRMIHFGLFFLLFHLANAQSLDQADKLFDQYKYKEAIVEYKSILQTCSINTCKSFPSICNQLGMCFIFIRQTDSAIVYYKMGLEGLQFTEDAEIKESILSALGEIYLYRGIPEGLQYLKALLPVTQQTNNEELRAATYSQLGTIFRIQGATDSAYHYNELAIQHVNELEDPKLKSLIIKGMGDFYADISNYEEALSKYVEVLEIQEESNDSIGKSAMLITMAALFSEQGQIDLARRYLEQSLSISRKKNLRTRYTTALVSLADLLIEQDQIGDARTYLLEAQERFSNLKHFSSLALVYQKLGEINLKEKQFNTAIEHFDQSARLYDSLEVFEGSVRAKISKAESLLELGNNRASIKEINKILSIVQTRQTFALEMEAYKLLSRAYAQSNDFEEAFYYQSEYLDLKDQLFNTERDATLANIEKKFNMAVKEKEILELQNNQIQQNARLERSRIFNIGLGILGVFMAIMAFVYYQYYQNNKLLAKQRSELDAQRIQMLENENRLSKIKSMMEGQDYERSRIAKDLHDGLGGLLSTIKIQFDTLEEEITALEKSPQYRKTNEMLDDACDEVRRISHNMLPEIMTQMGLVEAITDLSWSLKNSGIQVHVETVNWNDQLDKEVENTLYRVIQELFSNIIKHAKAQNVIVQLSENNNELSVVVEDDGVGFTPEKGYEGIGLSNIQSRIDYLNGELLIEGQPDVGTTVTIKIPS